MHSLCTSLYIHPALVLLDFTKPFQIESDAFDTAVGGVLTQEHASIHKPISFLSKTLTSSEKNYSIHDCKLFAIITYHQAWRPYIDRQ